MSKVIGRKVVTSGNPQIQIALHMHKHIFKSIQITGSNKMDIRDGLHHVNDPGYRDTGSVVLAESQGAAAGHHQVRSEQQQE